jgi:hypothetical protein
MPLSKSQLKRVQRMFRDEWESKDELWQFYDTITDPEELHRYADGFNWDTGVEELHRVIQHPLCDRGTAFLIYWRGGPGYYARYADRSETPNSDRADHFVLLQEIERKIIAGLFPTNRFHYDPKNDNGHDMTTKYSSGPKKRSIPPEMFA